MSGHQRPTRRLAWQALVCAPASLLLPGLGWAQRPALMLANSYRAGGPLQDYWVSEKYDGVRGYWDGRRLWTRGGEPVHAPAWFTANWPLQPLDGELWAGRGAFAQAVSTVRQQAPQDAAWQGIHFMVFDLPGQEGTFDRRRLELTRLLGERAIPWLKAVEQVRVDSHAALQAMMQNTVQAGGEGLMLHRGDSLYQGSRSDDLLKFKPHADAEARVVAHLPGKGKNEGLLGALLLETAEGLRFKLGTGLTDQARRNPPAVGSWVTYRYRDRHPSGVPRFASYLRMAEGPPP